MKNWSLSKKIWSIIGVLSFAFVFSSVFSLKELVNSKNALKEITETLVKRDQLTSEIKDNQRRITSLTLESILRTDEASLKKVSQIFSQIIEKQDNELKRFVEISDGEGRELLSKYLVEYKVVLEAMQRAQSLGAKNKNAEATEVAFSVDSNLNQMRAYIDQLNKLTADRLKTVSVESNAKVNQAIILNSMISIISIAVSLLVAFFVLRSMTRTIAQIVAGLSDSSNQVSSASTQIASASEQLSQATTEQAASLEETAASVEEMNSMVTKNSENASSAASSSSTSQKKAIEGKTIVENMSQSMEAINRSNTAVMNQVNQSNESMAGIVKVIEQIDKKTKVINEIVNKTELLSFNASVEAARAGEHGKGFAVVAEEVGNLARMSGAAAEEIGTLLEESINKVNQIVHETKSSVEKLINEGKETIERGAQVTRQCGEVFEEVVQNVTSVSGMATEIASASQEQSRGISEITKAMSQLDQMTQQNAATSEECASAAEELSSQAEALKNAVNQLVLTVNGNDGATESFDVRSAATPIVRKAPVVPKAPTARNVVHLKSPKIKNSATKGDQVLKASGDAPQYDSDGFKDV